MKSAHRPRLLLMRCVQVIALGSLAALTLAPPLLGRAGFLLVTPDVSARIFPVHLHGIAGEEAFVSHHGVAAPFVQDHCHAEPGAAQAETPGQFAVGSLLFGPLLGGHTAAVPSQLPAAFVLLDVATPSLQGITSRPASPPPQAAT